MGTGDRGVPRTQTGPHHDLRSTFASNALAAGVSVFELARRMGTSIALIERHYGALLDGSGADFARRLSAFEATAGEDEARSGDN